MEIEPPFGSHDMEQLTKKERKALRREEKKQAAKKATQGNRIKAILVWVGVLAVGSSLLYGGYRILTSEKESLGEDESVGIEVMSDRTHIPAGSARPDYNSNPPSSGPHYGDTAKRGVHDEELSDGQLIHNLEHGEVWISYRPDISETAKEELRNITRSLRKAVLTVRSANEKDIALAAWGRIDNFGLNPDGTVPRKRIEDFYARYKDKGPEFFP